MINAGRSFSGHERNGCFLNVGAAGKKRFANVSAVIGFDFADDARAIATTDWDHDGDLDVWVSNRNAPRLRFLRNDAPLATTRSIVLKLRGDGTTSNRDAIGARVEILLESPTSTPRPRLHRTLRAGEGFLSQGSKWLHFGLGDNSKILGVRVRWPNQAATIEQFSGVVPGGRYLLEQGRGTPSRMAPRNPKPGLSPGSPAPPPPTQIARVPLVTLLPRPPLDLRNLTGKRIYLDSDGPILVNLWASWCGPCLSELSEFTTQQEDLKKAGLQIVAVSTEGHEDKDTASAAQAALKKIQWPFRAALATEQTLTTLQSLHNALIALNQPLPLPTSILFDAQGRLSVIYKGPVSPEQVLADLNHSSGTREERWIGAAPLPGATIKHAVVQEKADTIESIVHYRNGLAQEHAKRFPAASYHYSAAAQHQPKFPAAHRRLGNLAMRAKNWAEAIQHYEVCLAEESDPATHFALAGAYRQHSQLDNSIGHYDKALRLNPQHVLTGIRLAEVLAESGKTAEALQTALATLSVAESQQDLKAIALLKARIQTYRASEDPN